MRKKFWILSFRNTLPLLWFCLFVPTFFAGHAQPASFNFRHLTDAEGLSDGVVHAFAQDQYGFIWIGTSYGLNRFDGINIKSYFSKQGDAGTLCNNFVQSLYHDSKSNLWVGTFSGLCRFDYKANRFVNYRSSKPLFVDDIKEDNKGNIWLATNDGLWIVQERDSSLQPFSLPRDEVFQQKFRCHIRQIVGSPGSDWYMATTQGGIRIFNPDSYAYDEIRYRASDSFSLSNDLVISLALDSSGYLWATCAGPQSMLNRIDLQDQTVKHYDHFITADKKWRTNSLQEILVDQKGRLWVTSVLSGLSLYDAKRDTFYDNMSDPFIPNTILSNQNISMFRSHDGIIWLGTSGYGISYFHPDNNVFFTVYPFVNSDVTIKDTWCRAACGDKAGNIWMGTAKGVAEYDDQWNLIRTLSNDVDKKPALYTNSVRSLLMDDEGDLWIGTAQGLNRYHPSDGTMDFFNGEQGIPLSFFWMMAKDKAGDVWLGSASGLFRYVRNENRFDDLRKDSLLAPYAGRNVQALYADIHNRLWIGILDVGVVIYDIDLQHVQLLTIEDALVSDTRFSCFAEDQDGVIWIGSEDGLVAYDTLQNRSRFYSREDGLPSSRTNCILVDPSNRVWVGTSNGLCMLNRERNAFKRFDVTDGLLTNHFNEQAAYAAPNGLFIYPTYKGFLIFDPEAYRQNNATVPVFITSFQISDTEIPFNTLDLEEMQLRHNENFFNIEIVGLNFMNPHQCKYAYQLDPFDKSWNYSSKREINYTNVPAGRYTFRYKAITDNPGWNVPEKSLEISIREIFYKTWWFRSFILVVLGGGVIGFFRYRIRQRERMLVLKNKAQLLEKEKTLVMYENLKEHLNPHFLFNSLTSLSRLIRVDQAMAGNFLDTMSKVYRYILKNRDNETVPLTEELNFVNQYIQLQKTRFKNGLQVHIRVDEELLHRKIAPVTLQNLVENAIKHNIADADSPLVIDLFVEEDYLIVRNNLQKRKFVETSNQQGLASMTSLYRYLSQRPMVIDEDTQYFTVKIPLL